MTRDYRVVGHGQLDDAEDTFTALTYSEALALPGRAGPQVLDDGQRLVGF